MVLKTFKCFRRSNNTLNHLEPSYLLNLFFSPSYNMYPMVQLCQVTYHSWKGVFQNSFFFLNNDYLSFYTQFK